MELFDSLRFKIVRRGIKIVFPEATDARILGAAARLKAEELVEPILVGNEEEIRNAAHARGIKTSSFTIISPDNYDKWDEMVDAFVERRNGKASKEQAEKILKDVNYFGTMLTYMGDCRRNGLWSDPFDWRHCSPSTSDHQNKAWHQSDKRSDDHGTWKRSRKICLFGLCDQRESNCARIG